MPARARAYQTQITGRTGEAYFIGDVKYDGFKDGVLIECKGPGYVTFLKNPDEFQSWFRNIDRLVHQASSQSRAAGNMPLEWHVAEPEFKAILERLFQKSEIIGIKVIHTPALQ